jgi:outer membrane autotransporter protein
MNRDVQAAKAIRKRNPKLSPLARAVRGAFAASAAMLALAGSGPALAGDCTAPADNTIHCNGDFNDTLAFDVEDLTLVVGDEAPSTITPAAGAPGILADWEGDIAVVSAADITTLYADGIDAIGNGDIVVGNSGAIDAESFGQAIGIYAYSYDGDVTVSNGGSILAYAYAGLADGNFASGENVSVGNAGDGLIVALGYDWAAGIEAQGSDSVDVTNDGDIAVRTYGAGEGFGIYAAGGDGGATVGNTGTVYVRGYDQATGIYATASGDIDVDNSGGVYAGYLAFDDAGNPFSSSYATAIFATSDTAGTATTVENTGTLQAASFYASSGVEIRSLGDGASASITNSGDVTAVAIGRGGAATALVASANGDASVDNTAALVAYSGGMAYGAVAVAFNGDASVTNAGDITAIGTGFGSYASYGLVAGSANGGASIDNSGSIYAHNAYISAGLDANGMTGATVANTGAIDADAFVSYGIRASSGQGDVAIDNGGAIDAHYSGAYYLGYAFGMFARTVGGDIAIDNGGDISAEGGLQGVGIFATSSSGDIALDNSGDVSASTYFYTAVGLFARASGGTATISTSGDIDSTAASLYGTAYGVLGRGAYVDATNTGDITASGYVVGVGASVAAYLGGSFQNEGDIDAQGGFAGEGVLVTARYGDAGFTNAGDIHAEGGSDAIGANVGAYTTQYTTYGENYYAATASAANTGSISASSPYAAYALAVSGPNVIVDNGGDLSAKGDFAFGLVAHGNLSTAIDNSGGITAHGDSYAVGILTPFAGSILGYIGSSVDNSGTVSAIADDGIAVGVNVAGGTLDNSGHITAEAGGTAGYALGVNAAYGSVVNSGEISASHYSLAIGVLAGSYYDAATVENSGTIRAETEAGNGAIAILAEQALEVDNTGGIYGTIESLQGDAAIVVHNDGGGVWGLDGLANVFGSGDDAIENGAGGTIHLSDGALYLGASSAAGNSFQNDGTILTSDFGVIDMGTGPVSLAPSLNPLPLVNDGIIDFVDGAPDDTLVVLGDLGGDGAINLDVSLLNGGGDLLYVDGNVVDGAHQAINLAIDGVPTALHGEMAPVVAVTGDVPSGVFTGGQVLNFDASNFLDLGVSVQAAPVGGVNVVSAAVDVEGLNDTGVLAASVAQGTQSLVDSAIGTLRQRLGVQGPLADGQAGISPWVRFYTGKGDVSPEAAGFGSGADFGFEQENRGREFGFDFAVGNGFHVGILGTNADGTQRMTGAAGSDRLKLHGSGVYASWFGSRFYVDVSQRWMDFDARLDSATGELETSGNATATNIEAGLTGWSAGGIDIVPQVQYTRAKIDNVGPLDGSLVRMDIDGGASERGRVGVALSRSFAGANGLQWTPYGALSAVREFDGETGFTVADAFSGTTSTEGTGTLAELGIGVRKGGLSATAGFNWADGGASDNMRGGQLVVRYTW